MGRKFVGNAEVVGAGARRPMMTTTSCVEREVDGGERGWLLSR